LTCQGFETIAISSCLYSITL